MYLSGNIGLNYLLIFQNHGLHPPTIVIHFSCWIMEGKDLERYKFLL